MNYNPLPSAAPPLPTYASLTTLTLSTTFTLTPNQASLTLVYPFPAITQPTTYKTITRTASIVDKRPPGNLYAPPIDTPVLETVVLPVLGLTKIEGLVVDGRGSSITTATLMQSAGGSVETNTASLIVDIGEKKYAGWDCWGKGQKVGFLVGIVIVGLCVLFVIWRLIRRPIVKKKTAGGGGDDVEQRDNCGSGSGGGGVLTTIPLSPMGPAVLVPDESSQVAANGKKGGLWLWNKKKPANSERLRSDSTTAVYGAAVPIPSQIFPSIVPTGVIPMASGPYSRLQSSTDASQAKVSVEPEFAYTAKADGTVSKIRRAPPIATIDANSSEQEARRQKRREQRKENASIIEDVTNEVRDRRRDGQKAYDEGHRDRGRRERSRSQLSDHYEKRGDRLRKESPDARAEKTLERKESQRRRKRLKSQRRSQERSHSDRSVRRRRSGKRRFVNENERRKRRSGGAMDDSNDLDERYDTRRASSNRRLSKESASHQPDSEDHGSTGPLHTASTNVNDRKKARYYPPLSNDYGIKHDGAPLQTAYNEDEERKRYHARFDSTTLRSDRPQTVEPDLRKENDQYQGQHNSRYEEGYPRMERSRAREKYREQRERRQEQDRPQYSSSPQRRPSTRDKKDSPARRTSRLTKVMTMLPIALAAIDALAEPDGGWEKYHKNGKDNRSRRSNSVVTGSSHRRYRNDRRSHRHRVRGASLDRATSHYRDDYSSSDKEYHPSRRTHGHDTKYQETRPAIPGRSLSRKHVRIVKRERSSEATVVRGGGNNDGGNVDGTKHVRISEPPAV